MVKHFKMKPIYVWIIEVWRKAPPHPADDIDLLIGNMADPSLNNLTLGGTMSFCCAAHDTGAAGFPWDVVPTLKSMMRIVKLKIEASYNGYKPKMAY